MTVLSEALTEKLRHPLPHRNMRYDPLKGVCFSSRFLRIRSIFINPKTTEDYGIEFRLNWVLFSALPLPNFTSLANMFRLFETQYLPL